MDARRRELTYLAAAVPMRLVAGGAGVALALAAAIQLRNVALGGALIAVLTAPSVIAAPLIGALLDAARSPQAPDARRLGGGRRRCSCSARSSPSCRCRSCSRR